MFTLYRDPGWTFPFGEARRVPTMFLPGAPAGLAVIVTLAGMTVRQAVVGAEGRVDLEPPLLVKGGEVYLVLPLPETERHTAATEAR